MPGGDAVVTLLWGIVCLILILGLAYWVTKRLGSGRLSGFGTASTAGEIQILARLALGRDQSLLLVRVGQRRFLLGATPTEISLIAEFTPEEAEKWTDGSGGGNGSGSGEQPPAFLDALKTVMKQRKR